MNVFLFCQGNYKRRKLMQKASKIGPDVVASALGAEDATDITALKERYEEAHRLVITNSTYLFPSQ